MLNKHKIIFIVLGVLAVGLGLVVVWLSIKHFGQPANLNLSKQISSPRFDHFPASSTKPQFQISVIKPLQERCEGIFDPQEKKRCFDNYLAELGSLNDNLAVCKKIKNYDLRDECVLRTVRNNRIFAKKPSSALQDCQRIVNPQKRKLCLKYISIYGFQGDKLCLQKENEPFEKQECLDRRSALQIDKRIEEANTDQDKIALISDQCRPNLALEYQYLCQSYAIKAIDYQCEILPEGYIKDFCQTLKIKKKPVLTIQDCQQIPLEDHRYVCLQEIKLQKPRFALDSDNDGLDDGAELFFNLDVLNPDTDGDGLLDGEEVREVGSNPAAFDTDGDGLNDKKEVELGTDVQNIDTDSDGIVDGQDPNPLRHPQDSDGDGLLDEEEGRWKTDPLKVDTDGDGINDKEEIENYTNPLGEGVEFDSDGDGLINIDEAFFLTDPLNPDTDGDGILDGKEIELNPLGKGKLPKNF